MDAKERKRIVAATLKWCNERRREKGLNPLDDLPKGKRWDGASCPCGEACGYYVGYEFYHNVIPNAEDDEYNKTEALGRLPTAVILFAKAFDAREFPEYEKED